MEIYLVGGAVRDKILNIAVKDRDWVVVGATVEEMLEQKYQQVGKDFPVFIHPQTKEEYALARTERKTGKGYTGFSVHASPEVSLVEDLLRRDLTINAIAEDIDGNLIDPFNGQEDIQNRVLRHVSSAFSEDPLRVLRVARFAARFSHLGFTVADDTLALMKNIVLEDELETLVAERVWREIQIALEEQSPHIFFQVLRDCDALARILPELNNLFGVPHMDNTYPGTDTGLHSLSVLQQAAKVSKKPVVRCSALMHGINPDLIQNLSSRLKLPNEYKDLALLVSLYHPSCQQSVNYSAEEINSILNKIDAFRRPERFSEFLHACEAVCFDIKEPEIFSNPRTELLKKAFEIALTINTQEIIDQGFINEKIGEELTKRRISEIETQLNISP